MTTSRTDYSRLKTVIEGIQQHPNLQLQVVVAGPHLLEKYGTTIRDIERDGVPIDQQAYIVVEGENPTTMAKSAGLTMIEFSTIYNNLKPDLVVIHGDRFENFAAAVTAALMNIPIAHLQGGEISGTIDESLRHALTKLSHFHFPSNEASRDRIIKLGEPSERVYNVGCPSTDLLLRTPIGTRQEVLATDEVTPKDGRRLNPNKPYALAILHPVTTEFSQAYDQMYNFITAISEIGLQTIMLYPNMDAGSEDMISAIRRFLTAHPEVKNIFLYKNFYHDTFVKILAHSAIVLGNSSIGVRETCYFGIPTVNVGTREAHRDCGHNVAHVGHDSRSIVAAARAQLAHGKFDIEYIYGDGHAGDKIADILSTVELTGVQKRNTF